MNRVLLIDDDEQLGPPLAMYFKRFDLVLEQAFMPSKGLARLQEGNFDAAILDIMLPEMDGFEVCRQIRKGSQVPIIMLTARGELTDRVVGLEMGADDYLPKPFEPRELVARRFRASASGGGADPGGVQPENASVLRFEGLVIDPVQRSVLRHDEEVALTGTEYELLLMLAREPGRVFSRDDILGRLRGHEVDLYSRAVDIVVSRLRRKLEPLVAIKTLRNVGYALALRRQEA